MPLPTKALKDFGKSQAKFAYGGLGGVFAFLDIKNIITADNKWKALLKTLKDFVLMKVAMAGLFTAVGALVKGLVRETGSLDAAIKKLGQMQGFARQFAPFVGGLEKAKQRIVELSTLSHKGPFKFEDIVQANKSLEIFTRGAFSSIEATRLVGEVAISSGNSIQDTAQAVGNLYDQLRSGQPIASATDQLRQMGVISESTANHLMSMASTGVDVSSVFNELTAVLNSTRSGAEGYKEELATVTAEHAKAIEQLQEKFGAPWTESDIQNTRNMTAAFQEITPTVASISQNLAALYNGFSGALSSIIKLAAGSKILRGGIELFIVAIEAATVIAVGFGAVALVPLIPIVYSLAGAFGTATIAATALTVALRILAVGTLIGLVAVAAVGVAGAIYGLATAADRAAKAMADLGAAQRESTAAMAGQVAGIQSVIEKHEAYARILDSVIELEKERAEIISNAQGEELFPEEEKRIEAINAEIAARKKLLDVAAGKSSLDSEQRSTLIKAEVTRKAALEEEGMGVEKREKLAREGVKAGADVSEQQDPIQIQIIKKQKLLEESRRKYKEQVESGEGNVPSKSSANKYFQAQEEEITKLEKRKAAMAEAAPEASSIAIGAKVERQLQAKSAQESKEQLALLPKGDKRREAKAKAIRAEALSGGETFDATKLATLQAQLGVAKEREAKASQLAVESREARVTKAGIDTELTGAAARRRGDVTTARRAEDLGSFAKHFEQLLPELGEKEAKGTAAKLAGSEIADQYMQAQRVVGTLQSVGGGGGVSQIDPTAEIAKRQEQLQRDMVEYLKKIAESNDPITVPTFTQ